MSGAVISRGAFRSGLRQIFCNESYSHRSFADSRRDSIHRSGAEVSGREDTRNAGLQCHRFTGFLPGFAKAFRQSGIVSGKHKSLRIPDGLQGVASHCADGCR